MRQFIVNMILFAPRSEKNRQCEGQMNLADFGFFNEAEQEATVKVVEKDDATVVIREHTRKKRALTKKS